MLRGSNVLLCVTGSIAAYKSSFIIRLLVKAGANVQVIMTQASKEFVTPLTLGTLSKNPVLTDFVKNSDAGVWNNHVDLGLWADFILVAPATANTIAKMAHGEADSFLLATYLSAKCPVYVAPAMDLDMYQHASTKDNLLLLEERGNIIIKPKYGELASGLVGEGRLAEPEEILAFLELSLAAGKPLVGKKILVTAGPTHEAIDPVRFIGNRSSGKMGFAIAEAIAEQGGEPILIAGPTSLETSAEIKRINVESADEMLAECKNVFSDVDAVIMAAAVADFTPIQKQIQKIKKADSKMSIALKPTEDILLHLGKIKKDQVLVGFAMETENGLENAKKKLQTKNLAFIVYNSLNEKGAGFQHDTNKIVIVDQHNKITNFELKSKQEVANDIIDELIKYF